LFFPLKLEHWLDKKGDKVTFYPSLVILKRLHKGNAMWFPYWHLVKSKKGTICKYGQWAPLMDDRLFSDLVSQAKKKRYKF